MKSISFLIIAVALLGSLAPASAQTAPAKPEAGKVPGRQIRSLSFRLKEPLEVAYAHGAGVPGIRLDVKSYLNDMGSTLPLDGATDLVLTSSQDPASTARPESVLAKVKLAPGLKSAVFMFLPGTGKAGDPKYRVLVMEDGVAEFPAGSIKVLNLSPAPVRIRLQTTDYDFKRGEIRLIENPPMGDNHQAAMTVSSFRDNRWQVFGTSSLPSIGRARVFQVFYENTETGKVEMKGIRDVAFGPS